MLSNAYFLANFRFDTAENERHFAENLPKTDDEAAILGSEAALGAEGGHRERVREDVARALAGLRGEALCRRGCVRALIVAGLRGRSVKFNKLPVNSKLNELLQVNTRFAAFFKIYQII